MLKQYRLRDYKFRLVLWVTALSVLGILIIGSADKDLQNKQILGLIMGFVLMIVVSLFDYVWLLKFYWIFYFIGLALLVAVMLVGTSAGGATRWLDLGFTQFQPSDLMKIILVVFFAQFFSKHEDDLSSFKVIVMSVAIILVPVFLIYKQPNLSTCILTLLLFCVIYFAAGLSYKVIAGILAVLAPVIVILVGIILRPGQTLIQEYQLIRILAWLHPEQYPDEAAQQIYSISAIGSGQLYGKGLETTAVASVKNANFLAEAQTDFIFAVAGEELGFLGCCAIIILEILIVLECIWIGRNAREFSGTLLCCGMGALIGIQSIMNICVATGLMPNTGLPLPFVSSGLTSLMTLFIGIGLVLNVGLQVKKY
ncbi:MAG: FtsW/RodA/SpoVE family cell cycle protein [Eubacteriales bacterium]|nr:FtsW/RodA/SpoVE family cell cycle protein [Eubacteriales bacterium]